MPRFADQTRQPTSRSGRARRRKPSAFQYVTNPWLAHLIPTRSQTEFGNEGMGRTLSRKRHSRLRDVTHKYLRLVNRHVRIADERRQIVDDVAARDALVAPVPR